MSQAKLTWNPVTGFELDLDHEQDQLKLVMVGMPVPADGTASLAEGVKLFALDALFRTEVDIHEAPGQLSDVHVRVADGSLTISGNLENADTLEIQALTLTLPVQIAGDPPVSGGPVSEEPDEDDVIDDDVDDQALDGLSALFAERPKPKAEPDPAPQSGQGGGLAALLKALAEGGDDDVALDDEDDDEAPELTRTASADPDGDVDEEDDGMDARTRALAEDTDALGFLNLLVAKELLELEDGHKVESLVAGTARILGGRGNAENKATQLSEWLFSQDAVGELYAGDDDLEAIIDQW